MSKKFRKALAFILVAMMIIMSFAGCSKTDTSSSTDKDTSTNTSTSTDSKNDKKETTEDKKTDDKTPTEDSEEPTTIRIMLGDHVQSPMSMDIMSFKELGKRLNININFEIIPSSELTTKIDLALASQDYPDLMRTGNNFYEYCDAGVFVDLTPYMDNELADYYKAYEAEGPTQLKNIMTDEGKFWALYKMEECPYRIVYYINQDWLDELGLATPHTLDELTDTLYAFKDAHPDGIPWAQGPWVGQESIMYGVFGTSNGWYQPKVGEYRYGPVDDADKMYDYLSWFNQMWEDGILDPDVLTRDDDSGSALMASGNAGFFVGPGDNAALWGKGGTDGVNFTSVGIIVKDGVAPIVGEQGRASNAFCIPTKAKAPLEKILEMCNYMFTEDGIILFNYGIEGETFEYVDGKPQFTDVIMNHELGAVNGRRQYGLNPNPFLAVSYEQGWLDIGLEGDVKAFAEVEPYLTPSNPALTATTEEQDATSTIITDINKYVGDSLIKFMFGEMDLETQWDEFQQKIQEMGFAEYAAARQAQYERWMNR